MEAYLNIIIDLVQEQILRNSTAAGINCENPSSNNQNFYYKGDIPASFTLHNNSHYIPYSYCPSSLGRKTHIEKRMAAFPYPKAEEDDNVVKAIAKEKKKEISIIGYSLKSNEWPGCDLEDRCKKPNKSVRPDILVHLDRGQEFAFPVPLIHCEVVGSKDVWSEIEVKGWVAALNALCMMPRSYYLEMYNDRAEFYIFCHNPKAGQIDVMKQRFDFSTEKEKHFRVNLMNLSFTIIFGMFDVLGSLDLIKHAQFDLDDMGKKFGQVLQNRQHKMCDSSFYIEDNAFLEHFCCPKVCDLFTAKENDSDTTEASGDEDIAPFYNDTFIPHPKIGRTRMAQ